MITKHIKHLHKNKHVLIFGAVVLGLLLYAGLNIWVFQYAKKANDSSTSGKVTQQRGQSPSTQSKNPLTNIIQKFGKSTGSVLQLPSLNPEKPPVIETDKSIAPGYVPPAKVVPTPTPTPVPGPGKYACDPDGTCGAYSDSMRSQYCPASFADSSCLGQCGDSSKRCRR